MKVLWICNILFPEAAGLLANTTGLKSSGGWMLGMADKLVQSQDITLFVATVSDLASDLVELKGKDITYYILPSCKYKQCWAEVKNRIRPDVVHIHGTESPWGLSYIKECGSENVAVSIQGLLSVYERYYYAGLNLVDIFKSLTLRDILKGGIIRDRRRFRNNSSYELELIKRINHVIGRTSWDYSHAWAINPNLHYHFCNEILRTEFYSADKWKYETCTKHTIFLSQGNYPIKGLHQVIKALPLILKHYPDTILRVAGKNLLSKGTFMDKIKYTSYSKYIENLIHSLVLKNNVFFTGPLDAEEMIHEYLSANVFICPSSIENSPNSLGEAQILGVPCISSYVGGVADMVPNSSCGILCRFEEIEMLAKQVCDVFAKEDDISNGRMIKVASARHDPNVNSSTLIDIYRSILTHEGKYK